MGVIMPDNHLVLAPPGAILIWNGTEWVYGFPPAVGYTTIVESGIGLQTNAVLDGIEYTSGSLGLISGSVWSSDPWETMTYFAWYPWFESCFQFERDILLQYFKTRHADELMIVQDKVGEDLQRGVTFHYYGPHLADPFSQGEITSGSPNIHIRKATGSYGEVRFRKRCYEAWGSGPNYIGYIANDCPRFAAEPVDNSYATQPNYWTELTSEGNIVCDFNYVAYQGTRISNPIGLSTLEYTIGGVKVSWESSGLVEMLVSISFDGGTTWTDWAAITNGEPISQVNLLADLSNTWIKTKAILTAEEVTGVLPKLHSITIEVFHAHGETHGEGGGDEITHVGSGSPAQTIPGMIWWQP
jgi:hypothetical protein